MRKKSRPKKSKIYIVDDLPLVRQGLIRIVEAEPGMMVCGQAADSAHALKAVPLLEPDLVIVDLSLRSNGIQLTRQIKGLRPRLPVLIISFYEETFYVERAFNAGADGYVMKEEAADVLIAGIKAALSGERYLSADMASRLAKSSIRVGGKSFTLSPEKLSDRELQVFRMIGQGRGTRQIAEALRLSVKTIETYREHIKKRCA